jgi:hypothetical protein
VDVDKYTIVCPKFQGNNNYTKHHILSFCHISGISKGKTQEYSRLALKQHS